MEWLGDVGVDEGGSGVVDVEVVLDDEVEEISYTCFQCNRNLKWEIVSHHFHGISVRIRKIHKETATHLLHS